MPDSASAPKVAVELAVLRKDVLRLLERTASLESDFDTVRQAVAEHRMRLENGSHVFREQKKQLSELNAKLTPSPPSLLKIVALTISLVTMGASALWALSNTLRDRPTTEQLQQVVKEHDDTGHSVVRDQVQQIRQEQAIQRTLIDRVEQQQATDSRKLDQVLDRLPEKRRGRSHR
jgi:hypothetical protein